MALTDCFAHLPIKMCFQVHWDCLRVPHHHSTDGKLEKLSHHANLAFSKTVSEMVQQLKAFLCLGSVLQPIADIVSEVCTTLCYSTLYQCVSFYIKLFGQYMTIVIRCITHTNQCKVYGDFNKCFLYILQRFSPWQERATIETWSLNPKMNWKVFPQKRCWCPSSKRLERYWLSLADIQ